MTDQCAAVDSFRLDRTSPVPVFQQIAQYIRAEIWQGRWGPGHNLPPEIELATRLGVARDTVRQAIQQLVREGLLRRQRGRGTRVVSTGAHLTNSTASDTTPSARHANPIEQPAATQNAPSITPEELTPLAQTLHALWSEFWQTAQRTGEQETTQLRRLSRWGKEMQALQLQFGAQLEQMQDLLSDLHSRLSPLEQSPAVEQAEGRRDLLLADAVKSLTRRATGKMAARPADLDELARAIYHETRQAVDATGFILALYDDESQTVEVVKQFDSDTELPGGSFPLGNGFTSEVIRTRRPRLIRHWSVEGPPIKIQYATDRQGLPESGITVPLLLGDRVLGALSVQSYQPNVYSDDDLLALQVIAVQAAVAVESLRRSTRLTAQLQRRLSEYETILESMADALLIVDGDGSVVRLTRAARELLCLDNTSIILGQPLDESRWGQGSLGSPAVAEALRPLVEALRRGETLRDIEIELPGPTRRVLCLSCAPVPGATGAPASGVIVFRDVTERWEAKRNEEKVLAIVSQELRTPLSHIKEQIEALACQAESADALRGAAVVQHATAILEELGHAEVLLDLVSRWQAQAYRFKRRGTPRDLCETAPGEGNGLFEGQSKLDGRLLRGSHAGHATVDTGAHPIPVGREMGGER